MKDLGLPFTNRGNSAPVVANTPAAIVPSIPPALSMIRSASSASSSTLSAAYLTPPSAAHLPSTRIGDLPCLAASSPTKSGFKIPARPESAMSDGYNSDLAYSTPQISRPFSAKSAASMSMQASTPHMRFSSFNHTPMPQDSLYLSQMEREVLCFCLIGATLKKRLKLTFFSLKPAVFLTLFFRLQA